MTITEQALEAPPDAAGVPDEDGWPVPDDPTAISMYTAHRVDETLQQLGHATERMTAARAASGDLRAYHSAHIARHLQHALGACHAIAANLRAHYPAEGAELDAVADTVGLAKAVSDGAKVATTAHLLETTLHEETHGVRHAMEMLNPDPDEVWQFNADHCQKHLGGAVEHAEKLGQHFRDNYPAESKWLGGLDKISDAGEDAEPQRAEDAKTDGGTVTAQLASPLTISGQVG